MAEAPDVFEACHEEVQRRQKMHLPDKDILRQAVGLAELPHADITAVARASRRTRDILYTKSRHASMISALKYCIRAAKMAVVTL